VRIDESKNRVKTLPRRDRRCIQHSEYHTFYDVVVERTLAEFSLSPTGRGEVYFRSVTLTGFFSRNDESIPRRALEHLSFFHVLRGDHGIVR